MSDALRIKDGEKAPLFKATGINGELVNLADYSNRYVLLSFFRFASCPFCNLRVHRLIEQYPEWQARGLEMLAVFESSNENMLRFVGKQNAPFPVIGDPANRLYRLYGLEKSWFKFLITYLRPTTLVKSLRDSFYAAFVKGFVPTKIDASINRMPADFLIGPGGVVLKAYYGNYAGDHLPFAQIEALLESGNPALPQAFSAHPGVSH